MHWLRKLTALGLLSLIAGWLLFFLGLPWLTVAWLRLHGSLHADGHLAAYGFGYSPAAMIVIVVLPALLGLVWVDAHRLERLG